jgi:hypothetical protein
MVAVAALPPAVTPTIRGSASAAAISGARIGWKDGGAHENGMTPATLVRTGVRARAGAIRPGTGAAPGLAEAGAARPGWRRSRAWPESVRKAYAASTAVARVLARKASAASAVIGRAKR